MKKSIIYSLFLMAATTFVACEPIENRDSIGAAITADQLDLSATPVVVNGKKSNKIVLVNHSPVCSAWNYGLGISYKSADTVLLVVTGTTNIKFTGLNPDGTSITKTIPVNVEALSFPVPAEWGQLAGAGQKTWVWDETASSVWGNGGYKGCTAPCWWTNAKADMDGQDGDYGSGGKMTFSLDGATLTLSNATGSKTAQGTFGFNTSESKITKDDAGAVWAKGKLTTKGVTVLKGVQPNAGNSPIYEYDILRLDNDKLYLACPEAGAGSWGTCWFWMFRAQ